MKVTDIIHQLSAARMEYQTTSGSVLNSFVVPFFIDKFDLRKTSHSIALAGSRGSGKSTYIQYFSHSTRFDKKNNNINEEEFDCIIFYWKPDIAYCQGLKTDWLGDSALRFFTVHASLSLLQELTNLLRNVNHHFPDLITALNKKGNFWKSISKVTKNEINNLEALNEWISDYKYEVSTRLNPINEDGLLSFEPQKMLIYILESLRLDYSHFAKTTFKVFIDEFELLNDQQQQLINTYRKESNKLLSWNVAYKINSKPQKETTSDQWLQSPDDFIEENLDNYIESDYKVFAAEIFILTLQKAGLDCSSNQLSPEFLGDRTNIETRKTSEYQQNVIKVIENILPTPKIKELSSTCLSSNSVGSKLKDVLDYIKFESPIKELIFKDPSLAITIIGTYKQKNFNKRLIEKYVLGKTNTKENKSVQDKISSFEFNTLLSLNLQHTSVQTPIYSGFNRFITMSRPNIRHFKELCLSALKQSDDFDTEMSYKSIENIKSISYKGMHLGATLSSSSLANEVISYPPHGNKLYKMVNRIGELFKISQKSSYQTEPERVIFTFDYDYAGADSDLEDFLSSALSWRVLVEDDSKRIKDDMQTTSKEFQLNPVYAPAFGISYRKKRGIKLSIEDFKIIISGSSHEFESIKKYYQKKWKIEEPRNEEKQGILL